MGKFTPHRYAIRLSPEQRQELQQIVSRGKAGASKIRHAHILLMSDRNRPGGHMSQTQIGQALGIHYHSVDRVRKRFVLEGQMPALERKPRAQPPTPPKLDGKGQAHLAAICCSAPPQGRARWTLRLMADELVKRKIVTSICLETVRQALKKTTCSPGASSAGASPSATRPASWPRWRRSWTSTPPPKTRWSH